MKKSQLKKLIFETYCNILQERARKHFLAEAEEEKDTVFKEGETLPNSLEQILAKFPTLKHCLVRLQTEDFKEFVAGIDWISPKPTEFRINLKNGQNFTLKWMGKDFEATISGKKYYLGQLVDFQRALDKLSDLYQEGPMGEEPEAEGEEPGGGDEGGFSGGGGGNFPGEEPEAGGSEEGEESPEAEGAAEGEAEGGAEDLGGEEINFEADEEI